MSSIGWLADQLDKAEIPYLTVRSGDPPEIILDPKEKPWTRKQKSACERFLKEYTQDKEQTVVEIKKSADETIEAVEFWGTCSEEEAHNQIDKNFSSTDKAEIDFFKAMASIVIALRNSRFPHIRADSLK